MSHNNDNDTVLEDLVEIQKKKDSIRKTYRETGEMIRRFEKARRRKRVFIFTGISAAACIAIILIIFMSSPRSISGEEVFNEYYQRFELNYETRSNSNREGIMEVYELYHKGRGNEALAKLELVSSKDDGNPEYTLYRALILMDIGRYREAQSNFEILINLGGTYQWYALWYSAMINIKLEDYDSAKGFLSKLSNVENKKYRREIKKVNQLIN